ncbi:protein trichome birefringence-like 2 [Phtheirospermum japonicum]|uniref:Protein trichome birefringence-like 2 n=1 Tax=Phtheirospermum japonicum TaxID=374723 RepID=A0A830BME8_9LAMI|nr:protein trichome birefringence-like 2 [Phtheirospermum japonicum]
MDLKKLTFPDQFLSSPRKKIVSPFGLALLFAFIVLSVVLFNFSSKGSSFNPVFQGLYSFGSRINNNNNNNNSSFLSWPFSGKNSTASCCDNKTLESVDLVNPEGEKGVFEKTHKGNESEKLKKDESLGVFVNNVKNESTSGKDENGLRDCLERENVGLSSNGNSSCGAKVEFPKDGNYSGKGDSRSNVTKGFAANSRSFEKCDIYSGGWVRDDSKPYYPSGSCPYIDRDFDCPANGRPDNEYVKWRWQPNDCDIPRLNTTDFLERLRGKKLVFVGDSLNRNMWESLVCVLRHGVKDKNRVYEISGRHEFKKKGFYAFLFEDYNCTVDFVSSPFLVQESSFNGKNGSFETLRLDLLDGTTSMYHDADVIIFNTGHWWTHEKTSRGEDYYQEGNYIHPRLKVLEAYKRALRTWARWVDKNIDRNKTEVIFRGYSVTHFRGGPWNSGGQCNKETEPIFNETYLAKYPLKMKVLEYVIKEMKTPVTYLNISRLTDYRKDGHPSVYRPDYQAAQQEVHAQDCSHWCLPGVPDTWNELLYASLLKRGRGSWRY